MQTDSVRLEKALSDYQRPSEPACKCCRSPSAYLGSLDFNRNCLEEEGVVLPDAGVAIDYFACPACGFVFSPCFDDWSDTEFAEHIYNDDYKIVDPDILGERPRLNAKVLADTFKEQARSLTLLDYGGGEGTLASLLAEAGFGKAVTFEPFDSRFTERPSELFNVITCFEVFEHVLSPLDLARDIAGFMAPESMLIFSTLVQPPNFPSLGVKWRFIRPRNGHISIHSRQSLAMVLQSAGLRLVSFNDALHGAFRHRPYFAAHFIPDAFAK